MDFKIETEYIELIKLLKVTGVAESGGHAKMIVNDDLVFYNGVIDKRKRLKVKKGDNIRVNEIDINVV
jgi:ribosome-associated protein